MADIFISYKSERRPAVEHLARVLERYGYSVWFDYGLLSGRDFARQIEQELRAAPVTLVLWCRQSVDSEWVLEEAHLAKSLDTLTPAWIEPVDLPMGFLRANTLDMTGWTGAPRSHFLDQLLREVALKTGKPPVPDFSALSEQEQVWRSHGAPNMLGFTLEKERSEKAEAAWRDHPRDRPNEGTAIENGKVATPQKHAAKPIVIAAVLAVGALCIVAATTAVTAYMMNPSTRVEDTVIPRTSPDILAPYDENSLAQKPRILQAARDTGDTMDRETTAWASAQEAGTIAAYDVFLKAFPEGAYADSARFAKIAQQQKNAYDVALAENTGDAYRTFLEQFGETSPYSETISKRLASCIIENETVTTAQTKTLTGENTDNGKDRTAVCLLAARPILDEFTGTCQALGGALGDISIRYLVWGDKRYEGADIAINEPELVEHFMGTTAGLTSNAMPQTFQLFKKRRDCQIGLQGICKYEITQRQRKEEVCK